MPAPSSSGRVPAAVLLVCGTLLASAAASAQSSRSQVRTADAPFASGSISPGGNGGYESASVTVRYALADCFGDIKAALYVDPLSARVGPTYWFMHEEVSVPPGSPAPDLSGSGLNMSVRARVFRGSQEVATFGANLNTTVETDVNCLSSWTVMDRSALVPGTRPTPVEVEAALNSLHIVLEGTGPLRNTEVSRRLSQARDDLQAEERRLADAQRADAERQRQAEQAQQAREAEQARRTAEAQQAREAGQTQQQGGSERGAGSTGAAPAGGLELFRTPQGGYYQRSTDGTVQEIGQDEYYAARTQAAAAERASAEQQAQAQAAARQADFEAQRAAIQAEQAQRAEAARVREQQVEELAVATVTLAMSLGEALFGSPEEQARDAARRDRERAADAAAYEARRLATFEAAGPQPICTLSDVVSSVQVGRKQTGTVTGRECRNEDQTSAVLYRFTLDRPYDLEMLTAASFYWNRVVLTEGGRPVEQLDGSYYPLLAGTYLIRLSTGLPGESGPYEIELRERDRSSVNTKSFSVIAAGTGSSGSSRGNVANQSLGFNLGLRLGSGVADRVVAFGEASYAESARNETAGTSSHTVYSAVGGLRVLLRDRLSRLRPYVEGGLGYYWFSDNSLVDNYGVPGDEQTVPFLPDSEGMGYSAGFGVQFFEENDLSVEVGLRHTAVSLHEVEADTGEASDVALPFSSTSLTFGLTRGF